MESDRAASTAASPRPAHAERSDFLKIAWQSGALSALPMLILYISGSTVIAPYLPDLMTNFFAGQQSGTPIRCEDLHDSAGQMPQVCIQGSAASVMWSSYSSFFSNAIIAFMLYPLTGVWSDMIGRKPFLLLGQALGLSPKFVIAYSIFFPGVASLYLYYPISMLGEVVSTMATTLAMISDCLPPQHRAAGFAVTLGSASLGIAIAPIAGQMLGLKGAVVAAVVLKVLGIVWTMVAIKETVHPDIKAAAREKSVQFWHQQQQSAQDASCQYNLFVRAGHAVYRFVGNQPSIRIMIQGFSILLRNSEFMRLTAAQMFGTFLSMGFVQVENQYLLVQFGFQLRDFAMVMVIAGLGMFVSQVVLMPLLLSVMRERALIVTGFFGVFLKLVGLSIAQTKGQVFLSIMFGVLYFMAYPSISGIKANAVPVHEQGAVQGALSGATALASGIGPLIFNQIYNWATNSVMLRAVPAFCAVISLIPLALICWLDLDKLSRWKLRQTSLQPGSCSLEEPLLAESCEVVQDKLGDPAVPFSVAQKDCSCLEDSALHRAGSSSRVDT